MKALLCVTALFLSFTSCIRSERGKIAKLSLPKTTSKAGIGLIHFNPNHTISLYKSSSEAKPFDSIQFIMKKRGIHKGQCEFITDSLKSDLRPYLLDPGDSDRGGGQNINMGLIRFVPQLIFRVIEKHSDGVVVLINENSNETCFIKLDAANDYRVGAGESSLYFDPNFPDTKIANWYYFETWEQAITRSFYINVPANTLLFDKPNGTKQTVPNLQSLLFNAVEIEKDWVCLTNKTFLGEGEKALRVWVKWKDKDEIKINLLLNGGYD